MPRPLLVVPLLAAVVVGLWLARSALRRWRDLKAAQTYDLAAEQRPLPLRAGGAVLCGMCVTALTVALTLDGRGLRTLQEVRADAVPALPAAQASARPEAPAPPARPTPAAAASELPPVLTQFRSIGHPV